MKLTLTPLQLRAIVAAVDYLHSGRPAWATWTEQVLDDDFRSRLRMMEAESWMTEAPTVPTKKAAEEPNRCVGCENATDAEKKRIKTASRHCGGRNPGCDCECFYGELGKKP